MFHALRLWRLLQPPGQLNLSWLSSTKERARRLLAGSICLTLGQTISYALNAAREEDLSLRPNDIIIW